MTSRRPFAEKIDSFGVLVNNCNGYDAVDVGKVDLLKIFALDIEEGNLSVLCDGHFDGALSFMCKAIEGQYDSDL